MLTKAAQVSGINLEANYKNSCPTYFGTCLHLQSSLQSLYLQTCIYFSHIAKETHCCNRVTQETTKLKEHNQVTESLLSYSGTNSKELCTCTDNCVLLLRAYICCLHPLFILGILASCLY